MSRPADIAARSAGFRFEPPLVAHDRVIARPRLMSALRQRFEHRLTTIVAVGGYGKTTAIALAIEANKMQPSGVDVWLALDEYDSDPARLRHGLTGALGLASTTSVDDDVDAIAMEVWAMAPDDVALVVDDVHVLTTAESVDVIRALLRRLPANGHVVLAGRRLPALPIARLRAHGQVLELGPDDLEFDDDEIAAIVDARPDRGVATAQLPRLPALADLRLRAGSAAGVDFLWEEILSSLPADRVGGLLRLSVLDEIDDEMVAALAAPGATTDALLAGLPLVDTTRTGRRRLHDLMRTALGERLSPAQRAEAATAAARLEARRGNLRVAVQLLADADDHAATMAMVRRYMLLPTLRRSFEDATIVRGIAERIAPGAVVTRMLRLECQWGEFSTGTDHPELVTSIAALAADARCEHDEELEAIVLFRAIQGSLIETGAASCEHVARLDELAATVPYAAQVLRFVRAEERMYRGEPEASLDELTPCAGDAGLGLVMRSGHLCSLGRPESVAAGVALDDLSGLPDGAELYISLAMWMRGEVSPEQAMAVARALAGPTLRRRVVHPSTAMLGVWTCVALAAGDLALAEANIAEARRLERWGCAPYLAIHTSLGAAALACATHDESASATLLDEPLAAVPIENWPARPYLCHLPLVYVLRPQVREVLDGCAFGRSLSIARDAARALVALRSGGGADAATRLPWHEQWILRAHVLPAHLAELAAAAVVAGRGAEGARALLDHLPDLRSHLRAVRDRGEASAEAAARVLAELPAAPDSAVAVGVLGPITLRRAGQLVTDPDWTRRARVRELLGLLVDERRISRALAAAMLWPELDADRAASNLRVTLTYLQRVLEPDRDRAASPFFVRADGTHLTLAGEVEIDAACFEAEIAAALEHDRAGAPQAALQHFALALGRYGGCYMEDIESDWPETTRARLRFLAVSAMCRIGELLLARGEPEEAGSWALRARRLTPLNERAERLFVTCLAGTGDRAGAVFALRKLLDDLAAERLPMEPETAKLAGRLLPAV